ncbi:MAG: bifunctional folylpolyglutamate synthase/dihydrofolate synthase [Lachnospiraceae bacterium]|nr:bifunctional folylpolyglutamate synthase/dihydrofolate synthase [Lachnospiraceae bacterium]
MNYQEALNYIASINWKGSVPGLDRIRELLDKMGNPQDRLKFIHVGGTNGKGSVCAFLSSILVQAGYKTGLFISPYIEVFNERMQINNNNISDEELAEITTYVRPFADSMADAPTEFELNTAIAMEFFSRNDCDIVILEVGMGGELDSTNIIKCPLLTIITAISLDHTEYLGDTIEKIAKTKSGIIKSGTKTVIYKQAPSVINVIRERCDLVGAELFVSEPETVEFQSANVDRQLIYHPDFGNLAIMLLGRYQTENIAVVIKAVQVLRTIGFSITNGDVAKGLEATRWPGRFEVIMHEPIFIVDGAHNPQGAKATAQSIRSVFQDEKLIMIFGVLADKDYIDMIQSILPMSKEILTVTPDSPRALSADKTANVIKSISAGQMKVTAYESIGDAIEAAFAKAGTTIPICAVGSLYMVGNIKKYVSERSRKDY